MDELLFIGRYRMKIVFGSKLGTLVLVFGINSTTVQNSESLKWWINYQTSQREEWFDHPRALAEKSLDMAIKNLQPLGASMFAGASRV